MRVGIYVDVENLKRNGGYKMQYSLLRAFACRDGADLLRANAYLAYDRERASRDETYRVGNEQYHASLREQGYKVIIKDVKWYQDENGKRVPKANADLDLAVDSLMQAANLDRVLLATGDGDFVRVVSALQSRGCRVEVVGLDSVSGDLRREADLYFSGFLIPGLIPTKGADNLSWGETGSRVRGWCQFHNGSYGFFRYLKCLGDLHLLDARDPVSPYGTAFFHDSHLPHEVDVLSLLNRQHIFEFNLVKNERGLTAREICLV